MRPIDQHLQQLLGGQWRYQAPSQCRPYFTYQDVWSVDCHLDEVDLRFCGYSVHHAELPESADIEQVHEALKKLFSAFPQYTGDPSPDIPF